MKPWSVPEVSADPAVLRALEAVPLNSNGLGARQIARSSRWLCLGGHAAYDCSLATDRALAKRLTSQLDRVRNPVSEEAVINTVGGYFDGFRASEWLRMVGLAAPGRVANVDSRCVAFRGATGTETVLNANYVWVVGRLFGGWDVSLQRQERYPVVFWRAERPVAVVMPVTSSTLELASDAWLAGAAPDGTQPPAEPRRPAPPDARPEAPRDPEAADGWLTALIDAAVAQAGGMPIGAGGYIVATELGVVRFSVRQTSRGRWILDWNFDDPEFAEAEFGRFHISLSELSGTFKDPAQVAWAVTSRLERMGLPPGRRPPRTFLEAVLAAPPGSSAHAAGWEGGRWSLVRLRGDVRRVGAGYPSRAAASLLASRLDVSLALRRGATGG